MGGEMRKRGRRHWPDEEKLRMMTEARTSGQSTSAVARRNGVNANQLFNWLRDPRLLALLDGPTMLPVDVSPNASESAENEMQTQSTEQPAIEIELPNGARIRFDADIDTATLEGVLAAVRRAA